MTQTRPRGLREAAHRKTLPSTPAVRLDHDRVHAWRLRPQRLRPTAAAGRLTQVATDLAGVQAQVLSSAALSLALRVRNGRVAALGDALAERRLVRWWAMREGSAVRFTSPRFMVEWRDIDPDEALVDVVRRYLHAYGPASIGEIARWWGGQRKDVRATLAELRPETTEVEVDGERALALSADIQEIERERSETEAPLLLGGFDPLIVGAGLRDQLIPEEHLARVSRTAGWISPVLLVRGRVAGVWSWIREGGRLRLRVEVFSGRARTSQSELEDGLEAEVERIGRIHGVEASLELGPIPGGSTTARERERRAALDEEPGDGDA